MKRTAKYRNRKVVLDGHEFDSKIEGDVYLALREMQDAGLISELRLHPSWELQPKLTEEYVKHLKTKDKICQRTVLFPIRYTADFSFISGGRQRVIDVKGSKFAISKDFPLRVKMLRFRHGLDVHVVYKVKDLDVYRPA